MSDKSRFFIGIPTINRADLLIEALNVYIHDFSNTVILIQDNGNQPELKEWMDNYDKNHTYNPRVFLYPSFKNEGVAESWNILLQKGFGKGYSHGLILNDDIYLGKNDVEVHEFLNEKSGFGFKFPVKSNWCAFLISQETFEIVGGFDNAFYPAYFEDNDYYYRMKLSGIKICSSEFLEPKTYRNSMSIMKDRTLNLMFMDNRNRYVAKWGGLPMEETFTKPFNKD